MKQDSPKAEVLAKQNDADLSEAEQKKRSILSRKRLPAENCAICNKSLDEVGGKRIVAQQILGIGLSTKRQGGGNAKYPYQSVQLYSEPDIYMLVWGEKEKWSKEALNSAKQAYLDGKRPWFCQVCGVRVCTECGSPVNYPVGSDVLYDNGCSSHVPIIPADLGCINPDCANYREWDW